MRKPEMLTFKAPRQVRWSTEGLTYETSPAGLDKPRSVALRRFWLAHNNGALSYHLSFSHRYACHASGGSQAGYDPGTYYFLSMLQKLAAPKEFALRDNKPATVFDNNIGITPLDGLTVTDSHQRTSRFWPFVRDHLLADGERLFAELAGQTGHSCLRGAQLADALIDLVPFIEVPGLSLPKSRFMFVVHDPRFFNRLMPVDVHSQTSVARKTMVQEPCYAPYQDRLKAAIEGARRAGGAVRLDYRFWGWVRKRRDYERMIDGEEPAICRRDGSRFETIGELAAAIRQGQAEARRDFSGNPLPQPVRLCVPAFEPRRADCLDYLFLSGFNQNIIDFMNQDTSEILDSIDPIYPASDEQTDERFFVRYANHRAMLTYLPRSRSLETGNDYIGTCPYAFLIHVLALHNEYLARGHEARSLARIARIERLLGHVRRPLSPVLARIADVLDREEPLDGKDDCDRAEIAINQAKFAEYREFERFRYANPFRYDTEQAVFAKLEELRGTKRKKEALKLAVATLEDHAGDLQRRQQSAADKAAQDRDRVISFLLGGTGVFGAGQMIYWIGETAAGDPDANPKKEPVPVTLGFLGMPERQIEGQTIMDWTTAAMFYALIGIVLLIVWFLGRHIMDRLR